MNKQYTEYSLSQLENWVYDALSAAEATPQEIYDVIKGVVEETYYHHKHHASISYELLALLNGNGKGHIKPLVCDKDDPSPECKGAWNDFWEENYYPKENTSVTQKEKSSSYEEMISAGYTMTADGFWIPPETKDKVVKWQVRVEMDPSGEYYVVFPDDLLEAANLTEGDKVEWNDNGDGSYTLRKEPISMDEC